jgi:hypothetical protein
MVMTLKLEANLKVIEDFPKLVQEFRKDVIEESLDKPLEDSVEDLKKQLKDIVNNDITETENVEDKVDTKSQNKPTSDTVPLTKAHTTILQYLTGSNFSKHNPQKDYNIMDGSNLLTSRYSKNSSGPNRIDLRISINPQETVEQHYKRALKIFESSIFIIPNEKGELSFWLNAGENLNDVLKIDCSTMTGYGNTTPNKGISPEKRFELDKKKKGYSTWTLKQAFVEKIRKSQTNFVDLNPVLHNIKEGNPEEAITYLRSKDTYNKNPVIQEVITKIEALHKGKSNEPNIEAYIKLIKLIDTLTVQKSITPQNVIYRLVSTIEGPQGEESVKFMEETNTTLSLWLFSNHDKWFNAMVRVTENLIKDFESR